MPTDITHPEGQTIEAAEKLAAATAQAMGASPPETAARGSGWGAIIMARHGEPDIARQVKLSAAEYVAWWARYEETGLRPGQTPPDGLVEAARGARLVFSSTRIRAIETATAVVGERLFEMDETLIEAPLPPPAWPAWLKFTPRTWGFIARVWWWFFNHHEEGQENRAQAQIRSDLVAERLEAHARAGGDVVVLAHGFFNTMIGLSLKKRGWTQVENQGFHYWRAKRFERR